LRIFWQKCANCLQMKTKYDDNRLAEEFDLIVLTDDTRKNRGLPQGSLGTLIGAYTNATAPLYAEFAMSDGTKKEEPLFLSDFRVLNERNDKDLSIIISYLQKAMSQRMVD